MLRHRPFFVRWGEKEVLTHLRLHGLCGEWKALWRGSDTVPEAVVVDRHCHVKMLIC